MEEARSFDEILDAADRLPLEDQEALVYILGKRIAEHRWDSLTRDIRVSRNEFRKGRCSPSTTNDIMKEILS
jgi:hypothetical protein